MLALVLAIALLAMMIIAGAAFALNWKKTPSTASVSAGSAASGVLRVPAAAPATLPSVPSWVRGDPSKEIAKRQKAGARNAEVVKAANRTGVRYDFVMYGDSITQNVADKYGAIWKQYFGGLVSAALGVGGNTVEELSWRVARGPEKFSKAPKVVALLIGINNLNYTSTDPSQRLDEFLLPWMRATWPESTIMLLGMLPNSRSDVRPFNSRYSSVAKKHGVVFLDCGGDLDPKNPRHFTDGTHPAADGYRRIFGCLSTAVKKHV